MGQAPIRVLLIEDDEFDYLRIRRMLSQISGQHYELDRLSSYEAGLDAIRRDGHDIYLVDYRLDSSSGLEILEQCRAAGFRSPIVLLTGIADYRIDFQAMKLGAADFLVKDQITPALLERSVRYALQQAGVMEQLRVQKEQLRASELRFRSVVQSATDAIVLADGGGRIIFWNRAAEKTFGHREEEILRQNTEALIPERYRAAHRDGLERFRTTGRSHIIGRTVEFEGLKKDGSEFPVELSLACWHTTEETFFTAIVRDVTERRKADQLRMAKDAAEEASRAKSSIVAKVSHELRTPLTAIIGLTRILLQNRDGNLSVQDLDLLNRIFVNAKDQFELISGMLDLSKIEAGRMEIHPEPVAIDGLVREIVGQLESQRKSANIGVEVSFPSRVAPITTDRGKLKQVLVNLIENALKFTERGCVTISVETGPNHVPRRIDVTDTGIGIPEDQIAAIFEPFCQAERDRERFGGAGLGLSICRSICDLLGYRIEVRSRRGCGSTFSVVLAAKQGRLPLTA